MVLRMLLHCRNHVLLIPVRSFRLELHGLRRDAPDVRNLSSQRGRDIHDADDAQPKASAKTKRAKSMARLINSKPWSSEIESALSSVSPSLSKNTVLQTLNLIKSTAKALKFFDWVQRTGFSHNDQSFFLMLEILGRARNLNVARNFLFSIEKRSNGSVKLEDRFFNSVIRSYGNAGLFQESIKLFDTMKENGVSPTGVTFNSLLLILLKRGRTNMARSLFDEMPSQYGVMPDAYTFNILIRGFCKNSMVEEAFRIFNKMERFKCDPDLVTYNTIIDGLCRVGKVKVAHNVVKGMDRKARELHPNIITYTTLVRGYCMKRNFDGALIAFDEMTSRGLKPNKITYNTLIKGLCEGQRFDKISETLLQGFTPDTCTFNTLISAHCSEGRLDEALKVFERMPELSVQPDSATYSILIRKMCQMKDFDVAEELFDQLLEKELLLTGVGSPPLVAAYNLMFQYLCAIGKTKKAEKVFRQLMKRGVQDPPSFKILIMGHCRENSFEDGYELLILMLRRNFVPDIETYESLMSGFLQKGEALLAYETLLKMIKSSHMPGSSTFHSILAALLKKRCAHESFGLLKLMMEKSIRQNINLSTSTIRLLFGNGLKYKAFQIMRMIYESGYLVNMQELVQYLCQTKRVSEAYDLLLYCFEKHLLVDVSTCNAVVEGLCKRKRPSDAFRLYYEMVESGNHQQLHCQEDLIKALEAGGKVEEVEFVSKRMRNMQQSGSYPLSGSQKQ